MVFEYVLQKSILCFESNLYHCIYQCVCRIVADGWFRCVPPNQKALSELCFPMKTFLRCAKLTFHWNFLTTFKRNKYNDPWSITFTCHLGNLILTMGGILWQVWSAVKKAFDPSSADCSGDGEVEQKNNHADNRGSTSSNNDRKGWNSAAPHRHDEAGTHKPDSTTTENHAFSSSALSPQHSPSLYARKLHSNVYSQQQQRGSVTTGMGIVVILFAIPAALLVGLMLRSSKSRKVQRLAR